MNSTRVLRNWIKAFCVCLPLVLLASCAPGELPEANTGTETGEIEGVRFTQTDERTTTVKLEMCDGGIILIELDPSAAPKTVENFQNLVEAHFYDGLIFHRVIEGFMIQTGDPTGLGTGGSTQTIFGEFGVNGYSNPLSHTRGTVSMARKDKQYDSASSQFFICQADVSRSLDGQYAAFGRVIAGMDVVDAIAGTPTGANDRPLSEQKIATVRFVKIGQ